jgi:hypothetical protein
MEFDLVDAPAEPVVAVKLRRVDVGQAGMRLHLRAAQHGAERRQFGGSSAGAFSFSASRRPWLPSNRL